MNELGQRFETVEIESLQPHPDNPRFGDVAAIVQSIRANGFYGSVIAQKSTHLILVGNHRWLAAKELGMTEIPVSFVDVDDERARIIMLADNRSSDLAKYDDEALVNLLNEISIENLGDALFSEDDLQSLLDSIITPGIRPTGLPESVVSTHIVFDDSEQQGVWYSFVKYLKERFPDSETLGERLALIAKEIIEK